MSVRYPRMFLTHTLVLWSWDLPASDALSRGGGSARGSASWMLLMKRGLHGAGAEWCRAKSRILSISILIGRQEWIRISPRLRMNQGPVMVRSEHSVLWMPLRPDSRGWLHSPTRASRAPRSDRRAGDLSCQKLVCRRRERFGT